MSIEGGGLTGGQLEVEHLIGVADLRGAAEGGADGEEFWVEGVGAAQGGEGGFGVTFLEEAIAEEEVEFWVAGFAFDEVAEEGFGFVELLGGVEGGG